MGITNNTVKAAKAQELEDRVLMFLASGGQVKTTRTGRRGRTIVSVVHAPQVVETKKRYTWEEAKAELAAIGLLDKKVQAAIEARQ